MARPHPFLDVPLPIPFAHRGGGADGDLDGLENSMAAFADAVDLGYRYLETDVHATRDGVLIAFHDDELDRVTDRSGPIARLDHAEVAQARIGGREPIPRLEELVDAWPDVRLNLDVKEEAAVEPLIRLIRDRGLLDRVCVGAFERRRIRRVRSALGDGLCTSAHTMEVRAAWVAARLGPLARLLPLPVDCLQVPATSDGRTVVDERFVAAAHARGEQVHVWTVNDAAEMHRLLDLGVDGLMTDHTRLLRQVLIDRGQWHGAGPTV